MILLDTHIWFWFLTGDDQLDKKLQRAIEKNPTTVLLSPVSSWELLVLYRKGRVKLQPEGKKFVDHALNAYPFRSAPLTHEIAVMSETLEFQHNDPADRFIAATAKAYDAQLATYDERLKNLDWLRCWG